jgi:NitT/TauT family transport system substrate-binding protein
MIVWTARKSFTDKHRAAMVDLMEDSIRIVRWYLDPKNQKEAAEIAARVTKQPVERFGWLFTNADYYRNPDMVPDLKALQSNLNITKELGFVKDNIDAAKYSDLSIVQDALKRLN